ncbi:hypothetical protein BDZ89DRAFT_979399 [Hymenopellis radicata]|nr:hypothetical protein BDZ89DRAFT_979399 [Hymenopellis radicata]
MYGVIRFLDTELLPASTPEDYPKIIKSGIDEEGQHHKSPSITGPCGIATLFHRAGRLDLLERLLDPKGTKDFDLLVDTGHEYLQNVYLHRKGYDIEMGFLSSGKEAQHGVRYIMVEDDKYRVGKWLPLSTSDLGSGWGGSHEWVRGQGAAITKSIWYNQLWDCRFEASWTGITEEQKAELATWNNRRAENEIEQSHVDKGDEMEDVMQRYYNMRKWCRAQCGEKNAPFQCSKCKSARYCSAACQNEDWKYHKTYCGTETPIPEQYR